MPFCYGLLVWWPSGLVAFCYSLPSRRPYQKATLNQKTTFNQKATKPEDHQTRRPLSTRRPPNQKTTSNQKATKPEGHPQTRHPPDQAPPLKTCCKACWDTTCNACWDSSPPREQNDRCKNITLATTLLRPVTRCLKYIVLYK